MSRFMTAALLTTVLSACAAHSPFNMTNKTDVTPSAETQTYPSHSNPVRIITAGLPPEAKYRVIESMEVGRNWYGSADNVYKQMAERARRIGADAVINVKTWHQPSGFSLASPHGSGQAVKLEKPESISLEAVPGTWF